jgi:hypothetical protein
MSRRYRHSMREVSVVVSDPWSFVTEHGSTFTAFVRAADGDAMLLQMGDRFYVASPRGDGGGCAFTLIPTRREHTQREAPWGSDEWRGTPDALLAEVRSA